MMILYKPIDDRGFTLLEITVAVFLLVMALLGLISTTVIVIKSNSLSPTMTTATALAGEKMEELRNTAFSGIVSGGPETVDPIYSQSWTVTCQNKDNSNTGCSDSAVVMKTIVLTVAWPWQGQNHTVSLDTIVGK